MTAPSVPSASKTCRRCDETKPLDDFYTGQKQCKVCCIARSHARYWDNPEQARAKNKANWHKKREQKLAEDKARHAQNPARKRANSKRWRQTNRAKQHAQRQRRRAMKQQAAINDFTAAEWREMQEAYDHRCAYCHKRCKGKLTQDHIIPLSKDGNHTRSNIVPACTSCNCKKWTGAPLVPVQPLLL